MQQLILGTGTAIWWLTEPHCLHFLKRAVPLILSDCFSDRADGRSESSRQNLPGVNIIKTIVTDSPDKQASASQSFSAHPLEVLLLLKAPLTKELQLPISYYYQRAPST
jgi:hypothetical protein